MLYVSEASNSFQQNYDVMAATDVTSLDSDGELNMSEFYQKELLWKSYRFNDEELSKSTHPDFFTEA
jgi:hypothetical protein